MEYLSPRQDRERMGFKDILPLNHLHIIYVAVHLIALSIIWSGFSWLGISLCLVSYFGRHLGLVVGYHYVLLLRMGRFGLGILFEHRDDLAYNSYHSIIMSLFQWLSKLPDIRQ